MPIPLLTGLGAAIGGVGAIGKMIFGSRQQREAKRINPIWNPYQVSPFANKQLQTATNAYNDPSFGTRPQVERQLQTANENFGAGVAKTATDQAQELALLSSGMGATDNAISNYNLDLTKNNIGLLGNLHQAYGQMINEGTKQYQSQADKYQMDMAQKQALLQGAAQNKFGGISDLASLGIYAGQLQRGKQKQVSTGWNPNWSDFSND